MSLQYDDITEDLSSIPEEVRQKLYIPEIDLLDDLDNVAAILECADLLIYLMRRWRRAMQGKEHCRIN